MIRAGTSSGQESLTKRKGSLLCETEGKKPKTCDEDDKLYYKKNKGSANNVPGNVYQLKVQMLFLKRALENDYEFQLGTEVEDADKFDDIVFKYKIKNELGNHEVRFVQVKHRGEKNLKKIRAKDLLSVNNKNKDDFSLQKYFKSYCKIKNKPEFNACHLKDFIIYTNSDLDMDDLKKCLIETEEIKEIDDILNLSSKIAKRFKLLVSEKHRLYEILKETSDLQILVNELKQAINDKQPLHLTNDIFKLYHDVLGLKVFNISKNNKKRTAKFRDDFLNGDNLSQDVKMFREVLKSNLDLKDCNVFRAKMSKIELNVSEKFALEEEPKLCIKTELPTNEVEDTEIKDFFDKLVIAVNQPDEIELGEIITKEMGQISQFSLLDASLVADSFQKIMLDWFKKKRLVKDKEGEWLDSISGKVFMSLIEQKVKALISIGITIAYPDELASFGIKFYDNNMTSQKIQSFLSKKNGLKKILSIITPEETKLSAINVFNTLEILKNREEFESFKRKDSYIFIQLKTLLGEKRQSYLIDVFKSTDIYNLLIIDCTFSGSMCDPAVKTLYDKLCDILLKSNKKIIIISKEHNHLFDLFADELRSKVIDSTNFVDLTENSQKLLLEKEILFQGHHVCLSALMDQTNDNEKKHIDVATINKLIHGDEICIGNKLEDLGDINDYYIKRKFRTVAFSKQSLHTYLEENSNDSDLFVICGADVTFKHDNLYVFDNAHSAKNKFTELIVKNVQSNIHWLESDSEQLTWYKSHGSISNLLPYKIRSKVSLNDNRTLKPHCIEEVKLIHGNNDRDNIVLISDTAGMGKSTVLTHLSMELKIKSTIWITRINLNDYRDNLKKMYTNTLQVESESIDDIFEFLCKIGIISRGQSKLESFLFKNSVSKHEKHAFFIDGFDEISPDFKNEVIALLRLLQKLNVKYIFVTTRPNMIEELEKVFNVFSYSLQPFSKEEQIEFLTNFWTKKLELEENNIDRKYTTRLQTYVESMIKQFSKRIHDKKQEFLSIPLQTMMLAEVFQQNVKVVTSEWNNCKDVLQPGLDITVIPQDFTLTKLYDMFVEKKFYDLCANKDKNATILTKKYKREKAAKEFKKDNSSLALQLLFCDRLLQKLLSEDDNNTLKCLLEALKSGEHNEGIVDYIIDDKPHFIHRTFAEYFASFPIAHKILVEPSETLDCIDDVLINMSPIFMHGLIDQLDGKQESIITKLKMPLLRYLLIKDSTNFLKLLLHSNYTDWQRKLDSNGKTPLHYAAEINTERLNKTSHRYAEAAHVRILNYADDIHVSEILKHGSFKNPEYENSVLVKFVNVQDIAGKTALNYCLESGSHDYDMAFELLLKGANVDFLTDDSVHELINYMLHSNGEPKFRDGILGVYAAQENKYRPIQEKLFFRAPGVFNKLSKYQKCRILSFFFLHGRVQVIELLLGTINDVVERKGLFNADDNGYTPLDRVLQSSQMSDNERLEIIKYLLENGGTETQCNSYKYLGAGSYITMILLAAAEHGHIETLKYFVSREKRDNFSQIQHKACQYNQETIITYLRDLGVGTQNSDGNTTLHSACDSGANLEIIKNLIDTGDINVVNKNGETPLFMAVYARNLNIVKYLVDNGANVNWKDKRGKTPISYAFDENNDEEKIIAYLLTKGAVPPKNASQLWMDKITFFTNMFTYNLDLIDVNGHPRLHAAIISGNYDWAKFLVRHGAKINNVDSQGNAPLHLCLKNTEMVEILLQYGAIIDIKDGSNRTPLDLIEPMMTTEQILFLRGSNKDNDKVSWLLKVLQKLFHSQHLTKDLHMLFKSYPEDPLSTSNRFRDWGPYGSGYPDASDSSNPMRFILNAQNSKGKTLLHMAADTDDNKALRALLKLNNDYLKEKREQLQIGIYTYKDYQATSINMKDSDGNLPIHLAAQKGHIQIIHTLLYEGSIFCGENFEGQTPEVLAANNNHINVVKLFQPFKNLFNALKEVNINDITYKTQAAQFINVKDQSGKTPLHIAASFNNVVVLQLLINKNANVNAADLKKETPLHIAAQTNKINSVLQLLNHGAIYDIQNLQNQSPFDVAKGQCRELLTHVDQLFRDVQSDNPKATIDNLNAMAKIYGKNTISVTNARDHEGNTALHYAAIIGDIKIVKYLLENGAMYNVENELGQTPTQVTNARNIEKLFEIIHTTFVDVKNVDRSLRSLGFEVIKNVRDCEGHDLLYYATNSDESDIIKLLNMESVDDLY